MINFLQTFCKNFFFNVFYYFKKFFKILKKKFIEFGYFEIYRNRIEIKKFIKLVIINFVRIYIVYILFYKNIFGLVFNYCFVEDLERFIVWDIHSYSGVFNILLFFVNLDNLLLFIYILFVKVGIYYIYNNDFVSNYYSIWYFWQKYLVEFKLNDSNFSFFKYFIDNVIDQINPCSLNFTAVEYNSTPIFFFFWVFIFFNCCN